MKTAIFFVGAMTLCLAGAQAAEPAKGGAGASTKAALVTKGNPSGTWSWSSPGRDGQVQERSATLKREGDKLTGTMRGRNGDQPIEEGKIKDGVLSFKVVRERNGQKMTQQFTGKLDGDNIKGTMLVNRGDGERSLPWEAKRGAPSATAAAPAPTPAPAPAKK